MREERRMKERERNVTERKNHQLGTLPMHPDPGPNLQPKHAPSMCLHQNRRSAHRSVA